MFPKKPTKIYKIFIVVSVKLTVKISSIFVAFSENTNFNCMHYSPKKKTQELEMNCTYFL